jgi:hypothetical protein
MRFRQTNFQALSSRLVAIIFVTSLLAGSLTFVSGQNAATSRTSATAGKVDAHPFEPTEELLYVAEFSRALLKKVDVADFRFTATKQSAAERIQPASFNQQTAGSSYLLKLTGDISSKGFFSKLFNLRFREQIESIVEPRSFTVQLTKKIDEQGKRARVSETTYRDGKVVWTETDPNNPSRPERKAEAAFAGQVQDVLSAIYYLRTQPLKVGEKFEITVSDSGLVYQVPVLVVEKRKKKTVLGRVDAFRVDPQVFGPGKMLTGEGQFSIWITDDRKRIPVSARIKMKYGTFDINLRKVIANQTPPAVASISN